MKNTPNKAMEIRKKMFHRMWKMASIKSTTNQEWVDILKDKSNYDRLLEMGLNNESFKTNHMKGLDDFEINFNLVEKLKKAYPNLTMENIYFLYKKENINKIDRSKVEKCRYLDITCRTCELFLKNTEFEFNLLKDLKNAWLEPDEMSILDGTLWKIKKNKKQILENIEEIKKQLGIVPWDLKEVSHDFWSEELALDFDRLKQLQQQWRKFYARHLKHLNAKQIKLERWKMMKGRCNTVKMIEYNNMSDEEFQEVYSSLQSENNKSV